MPENNLKYAFTWLKETKLLDVVQQQVQAANPILGAIELLPFKGLTEMPQGFASAWDGVKKLTGASYKAIVCAAKQQAKGTNYWFVAEQTLSTKDFERHLVILAINEFEGNYEYVNGSIVRIF